MSGRKRGAPSPATTRGSGPGSEIMPQRSKPVLPPSSESNVVSQQGVDALGPSPSTEWGRAHHPGRPGLRGQPSVPRPRTVAASNSQEAVGGPVDAVGVGPLVRIGPTPRSEGFKPLWPSGEDGRMGDEIGGFRAAPGVVDSEISEDLAAHDPRRCRPGPPRHRRSGPVLAGVTPVRGPASPSSRSTPVERW